MKQLFTIMFCYIVMLGTFCTYYFSALSVEPNINQFDVVIAGCIMSITAFFAAAAIVMHVGKSLERGS